MFEKLMSWLKPTDAEREEARHLAEHARGVEHQHTHAHADGVVHAHDHGHGDHDHDHQH
jgi:hypothetical protein